MEAPIAPENLPGYKKKSFVLSYNGGRIWFEHLDGIYIKFLWWIGRSQGVADTFLSREGVSVWQIVLQALEFKVAWHCCFVQYFRLRFIHCIYLQDSLI